MDDTPAIATAGGAEASARSRHLGLHNALLGGVDVKSILPVVEARFALAEALARAERDAEAASEPERDAEAASGRVAGTDADVQNASVDASPSVDRDSKRARVVAGSASRDDARSGPVHVTGAPTPGGSRADDERFAFGLARVASPAFGLAGALPGAGMMGGMDPAQMMAMMQNPAMMQMAQAPRV